jgi:uncharacterized protein YbjQ (UPF0145 family)
MDSTQSQSPFLDRKPRSQAHQAENSANSQEVSPSNGLAQGSGNFPETNSESSPFGRRSSDTKPDFLPMPGSGAPALSSENATTFQPPSPFEPSSQSAFPSMGDIPMAPLAPLLDDGFNAPNPFQFPQTEGTPTIPSQDTGAPLDSDSKPAPVKSKERSVTDSIEIPRPQAGLSDANLTTKGKSPKPSSPTSSAPSAPAAACLISSTSDIEGHTIRQYLGLVSTHIAVPKDILLSNPAPHGPLNRLKAAEDQIQKVLEMASQELAEKAQAKGANGVVGVRVDFANFDAVVSLCSATGTAVILA